MCKYSECVKNSDWPASDSFFLLLDVFDAIKRKHPNIVIQVKAIAMNVEAPPTCFLNPLFIRGNQ